MDQIAAHFLVRSGVILQVLQGDAPILAAPHVVISEPDRTLVVQQLKEIKAGCDALRLIHTSGLLDWKLRDYTNNSLTVGEAKNVGATIAASLQ